MRAFCSRAALVALTIFAACSSRRPEPLLLAPPLLERVTVFETRVPKPSELPPVVGRLQTYQIVHKDTLLDVARNAGLGFNEVKDANRGVDEWIPPEGAHVLVPTSWILPRTRQRGLVINVPEMRLYMFPQKTKPGQTVRVHTWAVAIGDDSTPTPNGSFTIRSKDKNPTWYVPDSIPRSERPRRVVPPGPDNPMGEYRIRTSKGLYTIHGTDIPWAIGRQTTHGCVRLYPEDIDDLFTMVRPSMSGEFVYEPVKLGERGGRVYIEVHDDVYRRYRSLEREAMRLVKAAKLTHRIDAARLRTAVTERLGVPIDISRDLQTARAR
jgi:L,D-transpeptidase ErfK/SrfK